MKEEKFPHTRKPLHWWKQGVGGEGKIWSHGGECSNRGAEGKEERYLHRRSVPTSITSLRGLFAHPLGQVGPGS